MRKVYHLLKKKKLLEFLVRFIFNGRTLSAAVTLINASVQLTSTRLRLTAFGGSGGGGVTGLSFLQDNRTSEQNNKIEVNEICFIRSPVIKIKNDGFLK